MGKLVAICASSPKLHACDSPLNFRPEIAYVRPAIIRAGQLSMMGFQAASGAPTVASSVSSSNTPAASQEYST